MHLSNSVIIAVDLDGTLTQTDTLHESIFVLVREKPWALFKFPFWIWKGAAFFKWKMATNCELDVSTLPYNRTLIVWLCEQKAKGARLVLCTGANEHVAHSVSEHLGLFDDVIASTVSLSLSGRAKRIALRNKFGVRGYAYVGNSASDLEVWAGSCGAIVVNAEPRVEHEAAEVASIINTFPPHKPDLFDWLKAIRVHQWLKNLLLFVPLLASHQLENAQLFFTLAVAFFSFNFCASSIYIINDLIDLKSDRGHPRKRLRPFASARLPISAGVAAAASLALAGVALAATVGGLFVVVMMLYLILTGLYSIRLKTIALVDCLVLAALYTLRIVAGGTAVSVPLSFWLLAFSVFLFFSLALAKRYAELIVLARESSTLVPGRGYTNADGPLLQSLGVSSGYIAVLIIALYVRSEDVIALYAQPVAIFLVIPIILFWVSWVWLTASRGEMHDDPIVFAVRDKASVTVALLSALIFTYAAVGDVLFS